MISEPDMPFITDPGSRYFSESFLGNPLPDKSATENRHFANALRFRDFQQWISFKIPFAP
ncbi:hypothetical protein A1355_17300 [Methylomonas koyamae]|uniref:Uncharacterized protein n=1 Tax=Methylomonas koyamae TaxID=702114 RepID=A0A177PEP0_9GAMM|nr:hypothetical protein A1355_17300 [Methylomonas koyamae]